ncbi:MAG: hypothetical protein ACKOTZ_05260 [Chloroflexota bacterium]
MTGPAADGAAAPSRTTSAYPVPTTGSPARPLRVTIVAANPFEFDSRFLRSATSLAADGHRLTILGWSADGLPPEEELAPGVRLIRLPVDRRLSLAFRPLPGPLRSLLSRAIGLDPSAVVLPPERPRGADRLRHPLRRAVELVANARRVGPWTDLVVAQAPKTDVFHCQSFVVLPVAGRPPGGSVRASSTTSRTTTARRPGSPGCRAGSGRSSGVGSAAGSATRPDSSR